MHSPSPESLDQLMTCVSSACEVGHRGAEALQQRGFRGSPPGAEQSACPSRLQSETGQASPEAALPLQAFQGLAHPQTANA